MDQATQKRIEEIEARVAQIDAEIERLQRERRQILLSDEEYACYLEHYGQWYDDEPCSLREYYRLMAELETINAKFDKPNLGERGYDDLFHKYGERIKFLERKLAA